MSETSSKANKFFLKQLIRTLLPQSGRNLWPIKPKETQMGNLLLFAKSKKLVNKKLQWIGNGMQAICVEIWLLPPRILAFIDLNEAKPHAYYSYAATIISIHIKHSSLPTRCTISRQRRGLNNFAFDHDERIMWDWKTHNCVLSDHQMVIRDVGLNCGGRLSFIDFKPNMSGAVTSQNGCEIFLSPSIHKRKL